MDKRNIITEQPLSGEQPPVVEKEPEIAVKPIMVKRDWLITSILLIVIVFLWIGMEIYLALTDTDIPEPIREQLKPLILEIDRKALDELEWRERLSDKDLNEEERVILEEGEDTGEVEVKPKVEVGAETEAGTGEGVSP